MQYIDFKGIKTRQYNCPYCPLTGISLDVGHKGSELMYFMPDPLSGGWVFHTAGVEYSTYVRKAWDEFLERKIITSITAEVVLEFLEGLDIPEKDDWVMVEYLFDDGHPDVMFSVLTLDPDKLPKSK